jgi:hypothetical protein
MNTDTEKSQLVECPTHGRISYGIICSHLIENSDLQFLEIQESETEEHPWAWCTECDDVIVETNGDVEIIKQKANWQLVCIKCYEGFKSKHRFKSYVIEEI